MEISDRLFSSKREIEFEEFFLETQKIYCNIVKRNFNEIDYFVEPIENDTVFFKIIEENLTNYKILSTIREDIDLIYANMRRTNSFANKSNYFNFLFSKRNINLIKFLNQYNFFKKRIYNFNKFVIQNKQKEEIHFIKFEELILDTKNTMEDICKYLDIKFEEIVLQLSANRVPLNEKKSTLNQINDSAKDFFNEAELNIIRNFYLKFNSSKFYFKTLLLYEVILIFLNQILKKT